jgi:hypothetical protein
MTTGKQGDALGACLAWAAHPVSVLGLALLLLNDHVFKHVWPGAITGKLSDIAGMLMFPPLLACIVALIFSRVPAGALARATLACTAVTFAVIKATEPGATVASQAWSAVNGPSMVLADRTDLLALPALVVSWAVWRRSSHRPVTERRARLARALVLVPVGLLATTATSAPIYTTVTWVGEVDAKAAFGYATVRSGSEDRVEGVRVTADGRTFTDHKIGEGEWPAPEWRTEACSGRHCYRVVPGELQVQESLDSGQTWATAWQITGWQYRALAADIPDLGDPQSALASRCIAVHELDGGGHIVLVANGRDGLLRRDASGRWERLGLPAGSGTTSAKAPTALRHQPDPFGHRVMAAVFAVVSVLLASLGLLLIRLPRTTPRRKALPFITLGPAAFLFDTCALWPQHPSVVLWLIWGVLNAAALAACASLAVQMWREHRRVVLLALAVIAAVTAWFAQAAYRVEPKQDLNFLLLRGGGQLFESTQAFATMVPIAVGMVVAALAALTDMVLTRRQKAGAEPVDDDGRDDTSIGVF